MSGPQMQDRLTIKNTLGGERANNVLNFFNSDEGYSGGGFFNELMRAMSRADDLNLGRLALGFPAEVAAYRAATRDPNGIEILREVAKS